jgi:hypothetical protein
MREKGIDRGHAEADSLGLGSQPGTTPFVKANAFTVSYLQVTSGWPVIREETSRNLFQRMASSTSRSNVCANGNLRVVPEIFLSAR